MIESLHSCRPATTRHLPATITSLIGVFGFANINASSSASPFNPDSRGATVEEDAGRALARLEAMDPQPPGAPEMGDRFMLRYDYALLTPQEVQQQFGARFAEAVFELEPGWQGPIISGYGLHLVNVRERVDSRIPDYAEIRDRLVTDYNRMRSDRAKEALVEGLSANYEVEIDEEAVRRSALRGGRN